MRRLGLGSSLTALANMLGGVDGRVGTSSSSETSKTWLGDRLERGARRSTRVVWVERGGGAEGGLRGFLSPSINLPTAFPFPLRLEIDLVGESTGSGSTLGR